MRVLGIDPGTHTGWAVCGDGGRVIASGTWSFEQQAPKGYGAMFAAFRRELAAARRRNGPFAAVAYELPFMRGPIPSRILWGMAAHLQERAAAWRCRVYAVNTMTLKKYATGSGKADKGKMIELALLVLADAHKQIPLTPSEHEADAIHVARWARERARACGTT